MDIPIHSNDIPAFVPRTVPALRSDPTNDQDEGNLDSIAHWVLDADEEASWLYMRPDSEHQGLGAVPIQSDLLYLHVTRPQPDEPPEPVAVAPQPHGRRRALRPKKDKDKKTRTKDEDLTDGPGGFELYPGVTARAGTADEMDQVHEVLSTGRTHERTTNPLGHQPFSTLVLQNMTSLRTDVGNTGSVVWRRYVSQSHSPDKN